MRMEVWKLFPKVCKRCVFSRMVLEIESMSPRGEPRRETSVGEVTSDFPLRPSLVDAYSACNVSYTLRYMFAYA